METGSESLNVLNFNKMKNELQKMFEQDNSDYSPGASATPKPLLNELSAPEYTPMENHHIQQSSH